MLFLPIALSAILIVKQPILVERTNAAECAPVAGVRVCVPSEVQVLLAPIRDGASAVVTPYGLGALAPTTFNGSDDLADYVSYWFGARGIAETRDQAAIATAMGVSGALHCLSRFAESGGQGANPPGLDFASTLTFVLLERAGLDRAEIERAVYVEPSSLPVLEGVSDARLRILLDEHARELSECSATVNLVAD